MFNRLDARHSNTEPMTFTRMIHPRRRRRVGVAMVSFALMLTLAPSLATAFTPAATAFAQSPSDEDPKLLAIDVRPDIHTSTLSNGMQVAVIPNHRSPTVTHMVWYNVGAADEPPGKSGIAHFLEHLMFKGTKKVPPGEFSKIVASWGGQDNAFTSHDYTAYYQRVPSDRLKDVMELESDRMFNLRLNNKEVLTERDVILEERNQRVENDPGSILQEQMFAALFLAHPYNQPVIGWEHEIRELDRKDALAFYRRWYDPANAVVVLAGDISAAEGVALAQRYYDRDAIPKPRIRGADRSSIRLREPKHAAARQVEVGDERVGQPYVVRYYLIDVDATDLQAYADIQTYAHVLGSGTTSWLYRDLVKRKDIALAAGGGFWDSGRDYGILTIHAVPKEGVSLDTLTEELDSSLAAFVDDGLLAPAVVREQNGLLASYVYSLDGQVGLANAVGEAITNGLGVDAVTTWPDYVRAVDIERLKQQSPTWLDSKRSVTGRAVQPPSDPDSDGDDSDDAPHES